MKPRLILAIVLGFSAVCHGQGLLPESWYVRNSPTTNALNGIVYGEVFMAAGDSATVLISSEGSHWTSGPTPGTSADFLFAAYAPVYYSVSNLKKHSKNCSSKCFLFLYFKRANMFSSFSL